MAKLIVLAGATLVAGALGAVAAVVAVSLDRPAGEPPRAPEPVLRAPAHEPLRRPRRQSRDVETAQVFSTDTSDLEVPRGASLSELVSSSDERVRLETARAILRRGSAALAQVRALRPTSPEGEELARKLALALQKMQMNERHVDWGRRDPTVRMQVRLAAFGMVLPEEMLLVERQEFWTAQVEIVRRRLEQGRAQEGELALAELELARVRRQRGELGAADFSRLVADRFTAASAWVETLRKQGRVPPARIDRYEAQLERLRD